MSVDSAPLLFMNTKDSQEIINESNFKVVGELPEKSDGKTSKNQIKYNFEFQEIHGESFLNLRVQNMYESQTLTFEKSGHTRFLNTIMVESDQPVKITEDNYKEMTLTFIKSMKEAKQDQDLDNKINENFVYYPLDIKAFRISLF